MHRGWMGHPLFKGEVYTRAQAWEWLIHEASFEPHKIKHPKKMELITVQRGQVPFSYRTIKDTWGWGNERVKRFLDALRHEHMVTIESGTQFSILTIVNYEQYQGQEGGEVDLVGTQAGTVSGTHSGTDPGTDSGTNIRNKELKELKKEEREGASFSKNERISISAELELSQEWLDFAITERCVRPDIVRDWFATFKDYWLHNAKTKGGKKSDWFLAWKKWVRNEKVPYDLKDPAVSKKEASMQLDQESAKIQKLGIAAWKRRTKIMSLNPDEQRMLEAFEKINGVVWWDTLQTYKNGKNGARA